MNSNKVILGGIAGGVAFFFLGWLIYGTLLMNFMAANTNQCAMKPMADYTWWALIVGNLISGLMYAMIFSWSNITGMSAGAKTGAILGFMIALSYDLMFYSMSTMYTNMSVIVVDVLANTVMSAIGGAVIAWVMGMGKAEASS